MAHENFLLLLSTILQEMLDEIRQIKLKQEMTHLQSEENKKQLRLLREDVEILRKWTGQQDRLSEKPRAWMTG